MLNKEIRQAFRLGQKQALPEAESDQIQTQKLLANKRFLERVTDFFQWAKELANCVDPGLVVVDTLTELRILMEMAQQDPRFIDASIRHERGHWIIAMGWAPPIRVKLAGRFVKRGRVAVFKNPSTVTSFPAGFDSDNARYILRSVTAGPRHNLSPGDKLVLGLA